MLKVSGCIGVDEAGRGPWAGPLVVAAVILDDKKPIDGLNDSKALNESKRELLFPEIMKKAKAYSIKVVSAKEIDDSNILEATMVAMRFVAEAVARETGVLKAQFDGNKIPKGLDIEGESVVKGDATYQEIAAASILAKVTRDNLMKELGKIYPQYGFEVHKGYGTKKHMEALEEHGACLEHRMSYKPLHKYKDKEG